MEDQRKLIAAAITSLLALGITVSGFTYAADEERCYGVAKAGQNACNTNPSMHSCAGLSKIDDDANDYIPVPQGTCLKVGGKLEPAGEKSAPDKKI